MRRNNSKKQPVFGEQLTFDTQLNSDKSGIRDNRTASGENKRGENRGNKAADILSYIRACGGRLSADELHSLIAELAEEYEKKARAEKETENKTAEETENKTAEETEKTAEEKFEETAKKTIGEKSEETAEKPDNGKEKISGNGKNNKIETDETERNSVITELPLDYENLFDGDERVENIHTDSIPDALILSLSNLGKADIEYIASITGYNHKEIIAGLKGSIYQNPEKWEECFYKGWETADEYLSGNLKRKYNFAKAANEKYAGAFSENVKALEKVMPPAVKAKDIFVTLGSPWIPTEIIDDFIDHLFGRKNGRFRDESFRVKHNPSGEWVIPYKNRFSGDPRSYYAYGTPRIGGLQLLEHTLNLKSAAIYDEIACLTTKSGKKKVLNKYETTLALEKQRELIENFRGWVWRDAERKETLRRIFEDKYACYRKRFYDGSFLSFPDMDKSVNLYPYQKNAVARIIFNPNTLLAHDVGSGKTYVMIAAGMTLKRMGLSGKNLYVVPNNIVGQWKKIFSEMYPSAKILVVEPKSFAPTVRESVLRDIRDKTYDGIIMAYSCFDRIPISDLPTINASLSFGDLGITRLFVDEAHNYKNVPIETRFKNTLGINAAGSKKCEAMMKKVRFTQKNGGGVIFATGTPITNSITDAYIMQSYLQSAELVLLDLQNFDSWVGMFAELYGDFEIDVDTRSYRIAERFSRFHNLPELSSVLAGVADFHRTKKSACLPVFNGYKDCVVGKTPEFADYLERISRRVDAIRNRTVTRTEDNMLKVTTDGRKAALDLRLADETQQFTADSKAFRCAEKVYEIYDRYRAEKLTQIVFCDTSTPKKTFNIYDELSRLLVLFGVNPSEIAYVHDATTEKKRDELFEKTRKGKIRVLLGSTFKLGIGVNVQDKLVAVHHLDVPWRPADMVQREGRIIRPGNTNKEVFIYRYITDGSFDAYSWQILETKQNFIAALLEGSLEERSGEDIRDSVLSYAEVKALAVGNPLVKERVETYNYLLKLSQLQLKTAEMRERLSGEAAALPDEIAKQRELIDKCEQDAAFYKIRKANILKEREEAEAETGEKAAKAEYIEKKKKFNEELYDEITGYTMEHTEKHATDYCGFKVIIPANMLSNKLCVYLEHCGRYYVEIGDTDKGVMQRLYNCLEDLGKRGERLKEKLGEMLEREIYIRRELKKDVDYASRITETKNKLKKLDKELGIEND